MIDMVNTWKCELCGVWGGCVVTQLSGQTQPTICPRKDGIKAKFELLFTVKVDDIINLHTNQMPAQ